MAEACPTCLRPVFVPRPPTGTQPDPLKHCPRALIDHTSPDSQQVYVMTCLVIGVDARDKQIATDACALKKADALLSRAREVLVDTEAKVNAALDQLDREALRG